MNRAARNKRQNAQALAKKFKHEHLREERKSRLRDDVKADIARCLIALVNRLRAVNLRLAEHDCSEHAIEANAGYSEPGPESRAGLLYVAGALLKSAGVSRESAGFPSLMPPKPPKQASDVFAVSFELGSLPRRRAKKVQRKIATTCEILRRLRVAAAVRAVVELREVAKLVVEQAERMGEDPEFAMYVDHVIDDATEMNPWEECHEGIFYTAQKIEKRIAEGKI